MTVGELISRLSKMPDGMEVEIASTDSERRYCIDYVASDNHAVTLEVVGCIVDLEEMTLSELVEAGVR